MALIKHDGIDIKKARLMINGTQYGMFTDLRFTADKPKETRTAIGGEVKTRSGTDRFTWTANGMLVQNKIKTIQGLQQLSPNFVIEFENTADDGTVETVIVPGCQITGYEMSANDNSVFTMNGISDEPR